MKIVITKPEVQESIFPCLMIADNNNCIIMALSEDKLYFTGFCIDVGTSSNMIGCYSTLWGKNAFKEFKGKITLFN